MKVEWNYIAARRAVHIWLRIQGSPKNVDDTYYKNVEKDLIKNIMKY